MIQIGGSGPVGLTGEVRMWGGTIAAVPNGWLPCDGAAISRTTYSALFNVIGTQYGSGDGSTTFNLPDVRDRFPVGAKQDSAGIAKSNLEGSLNKTGGDTNQPPRTGNGVNSVTAQSGGGRTAAEPEAQYHPFVPPYVAFAFIIKT